MERYCLFAFVALTLSWLHRIPACRYCISITAVHFAQKYSIVQKHIMKRGFLLSKHTTSDRSSSSSSGRTGGGGEERGLGLPPSDNDETISNKRMNLKQKQNDTVVVMESCQDNKLPTSDEVNDRKEKMDGSEGSTSNKGRGIVGVSALDSWIDNVRNGVVGDGTNWDHYCSSSSNDNNETMLDYKNKADNVVVTMDIDDDDVETRDDDDNGVDSSTSNTNSATIINDDDAKNDKYFGRPLLPSIAETPRQDLQKFYPNVSITDKCYFTWEIGDMSTASFPYHQQQEQELQHNEKLYTGVFVCPITYEYFFSGRYQEINKNKKTKSSNIIQYYHHPRENQHEDVQEYDADNDSDYDGRLSSSNSSSSCYYYVWYKRKKWAEHGAAAIATSCFQFRKQVKQIVIDSHRKYTSNLSTNTTNVSAVAGTVSTSRAIEATIQEYVTRETKKLPRLGLDLPYLAACDNSNDNDDGNSSSYYDNYVKKLDTKLLFGGDPNYDLRMEHIPKHVQQQIQQQIQEWKEEAQRQSQQLLLEQQVNDELQLGREDYISLRKDQI